jgi:hypothetical protein
MVAVEVGWTVDKSFSTVSTNPATSDMPVLCGAGIPGLVGQGFRPAAELPLGVHACEHLR